ncbi:MAG: GGDEF domain-containing protein [Clostridiales bacterium]|nr:GGDEF domain-containing protein [Clostridiales bacterium]
MEIGVNDILNLIRICQDFDNKFSEKDTVDLFAKVLNISKVSYRIFINDVSIESTVIYNAPGSTLGEEFVFQRIASNDRLIVLKVHRFSDAPALSSENTYNLQVFGESVLSGICVKNLLKAYENARFYDSLTKLTNINYFLSYLTDLLISGKYEPYSVACVNIRNCGAINRIFGSDITDKIIRDFAQDSLELFDQNNYEVISRLSSDSFIMIALTSNIDRILNTMNNSEVSVELNGDIVEYNVRIRAGVVNLAANTRKSSDLIHLAEHALGFSRLKEYPDIYYINGDGTPYGNQNYIGISEISSALKSNQFLLYFKPYIRRSGTYGSMRLSGAEAVLRWRKDGRLIDPYTLVPSSGNNNLLRDMDDFLFRKTCELLSTWEAHGIETVPIGIQVRSYDYFNTAFADNLVKAIDRYHIKRNRIILEFDEESFHGHYEDMKISTQKFTNAGVNVNIMNYGGGASSLKLLSEFTFQYLKINPELMNSGSAKDMIIIENIISMASKLGYEVICSEPSDINVVNAAGSCGCSIFQGDLFEKALSERFFKRRLNDPVYDKL